MIEHLFGSKTRLKLLQIFLAWPEKFFYVRELARMAGVQLNAVRRELTNLEKVGLVAAMVLKKGEGGHTGGERFKYFRLKTDSLIYPELRDLLVKVQILEEREFVEQIRTRAGKIGFLLLTGFFTGDKDAETDMLVVGNVKPQVLLKLVHEFERSVNREIRYTMMTEKEFNERREIGDRFLYNLFEAKHLLAVDEYQLSR